MLFIMIIKVVEEDVKQEEEEVVVQREELDVIKIILWLRASLNTIISNNSIDISFSHMKIQAIH